MSQRYRKALFKENLAEFLSTPGLKAARDLSTVDVLICGRVENWRPEDNDYWDVEDNKSFPREGLACSRCAQPVVVSNWAYRNYTALAKKPEIRCMACAGLGRGER